MKAYAHELLEQQGGELEAAAEVLCSMESEVQGQAALGGPSGEAAQVGGRLGLCCVPGRTQCSGFRPYHVLLHAATCCSGSTLLSRQPLRWLGCSGSGGACALGRSL